MSESEKDNVATDLVLGFSAKADHSVSSEELKLEELLLALHPRQASTPSAGLWSAIETRLDAVTDAPGTRTMHPTDGVWELVSPGVDRQIVFVDRNTDQAGYYLRLETEAVLPSHPHDNHEHCVVLSGRLRLGSSVFGPGTYHFAERGYDHPPIVAEKKAMVFILGSL